MIDPAALAVIGGTSAVLRKLLRGLPGELIEKPNEEGWSPTCLAEGGARLSSIMAMLGHQSPDMAMTYIAISDQEVRRDYEKVLQPGAIIAGPLADTLRAGALPSSAIGRGWTREVERHGGSQARGRPVPAALAAATLRRRCRHPV